jgi:hypothetical protein
MGKLTFFFRLLPHLAFLYGGTVSILEVLFPSLRDPDFNRWDKIVWAGRPDCPKG